MSRFGILCIDDDEDFLVGFVLQLREHFRTLTANSIERGLDIMAEKPVGLVLLDINLGAENGIEEIRRIKKIHPHIDIVMLSGRRDPKTVVEAIRAGAVDYLTKPFDVDDLRAIVERQSKNRLVKERYDALVVTQNESCAEKNIIFKSAPMRRVLGHADQLKGHQANVLIVGETGTGKELLARYIHQLEDNSSRPFIAVNCAAIPEQLLEAELFGSEMGAYTGAVKRRIGKFELADGGDIFLDEIGSLRLDLQAKILRVIQEQEFCRLGGNATIKATFRVIAATNEHLEEKVSRGEFRMDLYHRIRVIQLRVPPLRERVEDIPCLVEHYLNKYARFGVAKKISQNALSRLMAYHWPGNIRELCNVVQSLAILASGDVIDETVFPAWAMNGCGFAPKAEAPGLPMVDDAVGALSEYVASAEKYYIQHAIKVCRGDKSKAARLLQVGRTTLYSKMKDFN